MRGCLIGLARVIFWFFVIIGAISLLRHGCGPF